MLKIAIIDIIGLTYDGTTLSNRGLGGSESAVILIAKELAKLGMQVTVYNNCIDKEATPGIYDGVEYVDHTALDQDSYIAEYDIAISSRTVIPFLPKELYNGFEAWYPQRYQKITAKHKILWLHDTFCNGDHLVELLTTHGFINEIFTLSDFHTTYISNCDHGHRRNFEVLKPFLFQTRNGAVNHLPEVDIEAKEPFKCVYNASVTKGMIPLVERIWPKIKQLVPQATLTIIGGYYRFRENANPDEQEVKWRSLANDPKNKELGIEFTGIIKQSEIAKILAKSSFMLYPAAFPETFGISSLESLLYNTPIITNRFGALEETAINAACYTINYAIEPNGLFPNIDPARQEELFIATTINAMSNRYLHQQKTYFCNIVKDIAGWDTVALQWLQHFYKLFNLYLPRELFLKVSYINSKVKRIYNRKFGNLEDVLQPKQKEQHLFICTPVYNAEAYINTCIQSIITQNYDNWTMYIIDDASTDSTREVLSQYKNHPNIKLIFNDKNMGAVYNQVTTIKKYAKPDDIVMLVDGDDWLVPDNQIFDYYNNLYDGTTEFTYGSCWSLVDSIPLVAQHYPEAVKKSKGYRSFRFNWNMPYTHLRTFKASLILGADNSEFCDEHGNWFKAGGDCSVFYSAIEAADPNKVKNVTDIMYVYNDVNPINDYKVNGDEQTATANKILSKKNNQVTMIKPNTPFIYSTTKTNKFSVIIPTMWRAPTFVQLLHTLVACERVGEIIVINNNSAATPHNLPYSSDKFKMLVMQENIYVNPAWNLGAKHASFDKLCLVNDDVLFDTKIFDKVDEYVIPSNGVTGISPGLEQFGQPPVTDKSISIIKWEPHMHTFGFGCLMFIHKNSWDPIPEDLKVYYGDNYIFDTMIQSGKSNYLITNAEFNTPYATTTSDSSITGGFLEKESQIYSEIMTKRAAADVKELVEVIEPAKVNIPQPDVQENRPKTILIAIPTNKGIEPETFKAIYDLMVPEGYITCFQYFYGYQIDQIRNLIAEWGKNFDYLFCVDSDISFAPDTLLKLLNHNQNIVAGIYIQRKPGLHIIEAYKGGVNIPYAEIKGKGLVEVDGVGFGCVLIKSEVLKRMSYPHFVYKSALDHRFTHSEDVYFCGKAKELGYKVYIDSSILCDHHGNWVFRVE